jgi:putative membrane-bound dehydrogenase-like protein
MTFRGWIGLAGGLALALATASADDQPSLRNGEPKSPREELATFRVPKGFRVELAASEPEVVDPVAIAFDEDGRLYVAEMRGYPNAGVATGVIHSGKIKRLEDRDGDGVYETATTFAEGLRFPTSVMPWRGGLLAAVAPDLLYFEDTDGDGKADRHRTLYTNFNLDNIQQLPSALQWGLDNWVYACAGNHGGTVRSAERSDLPAVPLRGRGIRFHPDQPGSLEATSGGGQFGLAADDWQRWFTATNSQHLRHIILPDHYLRRNPALAVQAVTLDIPDHGAACKVYRISPFEAWRVERTRRRAGSAEARRFPSTELVPGGYITSATSPLVYTADLFPESYRGNTFVCDPANNLIHRDRLVPNGATFLAERADADCEFMASTDNWFRPVSLTIGPDGALYVVDFYREAIETPLSLPEDIKQRLNLESRNRGRIWRIMPEGAKRRPPPQLSKATPEELVRHLADANPWWRCTAQRLLVEKGVSPAMQAIRKLARESPSPQGRVHALWTLHGLKGLDEGLVANALKDPVEGVREQALRLAEAYLPSSGEMRKAVAALADDPSPRVRFQLAFTLGEAEGPEIATALAKVARHDAADPWTQTAVLSSAGKLAPDLLVGLGGDRQFTEEAAGPQLQLLSKLAAVIGARAQDADVGRALQLITREGDAQAPWRLVILEGLGQGLQNSQRPLSLLWLSPPPALREAVEQTRPYFVRAANSVQDDKARLPERIAAARLLAYGPDGVAAPALQKLLAPQQPGDLQLAAVRALSQHNSPRVAETLLRPWGSYSPAVRREVLEALFARPERLPVLLSAIEQRHVLPGQLEPFRIEQLRKHRNARVRQQAQRLFARAMVSDRQKVVADYAAALQLPGDAGRGKTVFKKNCATCHRLENEGVEVGADLMAALRTKTPEGLVIDILDPSREVDPRYINYVVTTKDGRMFTGLIAAETASSVTLRRAEKAEDTVLRTQIDEIQATAKSLMPDNLETQLSRQDLADVIAYLLSVAAK